MPLPLILAGLQVAGGAAGAIQGNQTRQKAKGEIGRAYTLGKKRLSLRQGDQRQSHGEGLVARGLAQGGNIRVGRGVQPTSANAMGDAKRLTAGQNAVIRAAGFSAPMARRLAGSGTPAVPMVTPVPVTRARTLGEQGQADLSSEQQLEQNALLQQRDSALAGADAGATGALVGGIGQAVSGGIQGYQSGTMYNAYRGIDPVNPLGAGAWAMPPGLTVNDLNTAMRF